MPVRDEMQVNDAGHLVIGGCDTTELARRFGTPLYILDEAAIRARCRAYREGFGAYPNTEVIYAGKALLTTGMVRLIEQEGLSLDVVSGGELYTALQAGFPPERIYFHGNNKSDAELVQGLDARIGRFVVDNLWELERLSDFAHERGRAARIYLRITPGIEAHTHDYIKTGQVDSKFGFGLGDACDEAIARALALPGIDLVGLHCHIGSQILEVHPYAEAADIMMALVARIAARHHHEIRELDLGGGLGIRYTHADVPRDPAEYAACVVDALDRAAKRHGVARPRLLVEPGRSIIGEAGTTLYTIGSIKAIPGVRTYAAVDGGMGDNPRVALYQAKYEAVVANKAAAQPTQVVSVAGKCCESGDMLIWDLEVPKIESGDLLAVFSTGAYNYAMSSNYNRLPRPAMVLVRSGEAHVLLARERYEDLLRHDQIPFHLAAAAVEGSA